MPLTSTLQMLDGNRLPSSLARAGQARRAEFLTDWLLHRNTRREIASGFAMSEIGESQPRLLQLSPANRTGSVTVIRFLQRRLRGRRQYILRQYSGDSRTPAIVRRRSSGIVAQQRAPVPGLHSRARSFRSFAERIAATHGCIRTGIRLTRASWPAKRVAFRVKVASGLARAAARLLPLLRADYRWSRRIAAILPGL